MGTALRIGLTEGWGVLRLGSGCASWLARLPVLLSRGSWRAPRGLPAGRLCPGDHREKGVEEQHLKGWRMTDRLRCRATRSRSCGPSVPCAQREDAMTAAKERGAYDAGRGYLSRSETSLLQSCEDSRSCPRVRSSDCFLDRRWASHLVAPSGTRIGRAPSDCSIILMLIYWMTEALDHGLTALLGCLLF